MDLIPNQGTTVPSFILSPHQQDLLLAALSSNKPLPNPQSLANSAALDGSDDNTLLDYDYELDADGNPDVDYGNVITNILQDGDADNTHDKRSHPIDQENDDEGGGKRREGDERSSKKPGRKPLTSEPTTKRKAQNRAAQRAFRERKEKHLKDLETKVQDLEKASEEANHENGILRAQIETMSVELKEYRRTLSLVGSGRKILNQRDLLSLTGQGLGVSNPNDVNFNFEFPKFGDNLPGSLLDLSKTSSPTTALPPKPVHRGSNSSNTSGVSPRDQPLQNPTNPNNAFIHNSQAFPRQDNTDAHALFSQGNLDVWSDKLGGSGSSGPNSGEALSRRQNSTGPSTSYSSPSASSNVGSNAGLSSSCGTSPEPLTQSPSAFRPSDNMLGTIGEEHTGGRGGEEKANLQGFFDISNYDINGIDWYAEQNKNQFDPVLFGDYREPQNNILSGPFYDESFFSDAFPISDLSSPWNLANSPAPKKDLVTEIDKKLKEEDEVAPAEESKVLLTCNNMWEKIQACPKIQNGDIDMDNLCAQLQAKAKCSGDGPVVAEKDFKEVINSILKEKA